MPTPSPTHPRRMASVLPALALLLHALLGTPVAAQADATIELSVPGGSAGAEVTVRVAGFAPGRQIQIGFGGLGTNHEILVVDAAGPDGSYSLTAKVPEWVERHRTYYFFAHYVGQPPRTVSDPFIATAAGGFVRVAGRVTTVAEGCTLMQAFDDAVYSLLGDAGAVESGARVVVEGTLATDAPARSSACGDGPAIPVRIRQVLPG